MSIYVELEVKIGRHRAERRTAIQDSLRQSWGFDNVEEDGHVLVARHGGNYSRDPVSEESMRRIAEGVWEANGGYCKIKVLVTYLQGYLFKKRDYDKWRASLS